MQLSDETTRSDFTAHATVKSNKTAAVLCFVFLLLQACICTTLGVVIFMSPQWLTDMTTIAATSVHGTTDLRATYGGLFTAAGIASLAALVKEQWRPTVLSTLMIIYSGLGIARVAAALVWSDYSTYTVLCTVFEILSAIFALAMLFSYRRH